MSGSYKRISSKQATPVLYRVDITWNIDLVLRVTGEGNTVIADDYAIIIRHGIDSFAVSHNTGPFQIKVYYTKDYTKLYVYVGSWGTALVYFTNRIPFNNTVTLTEENVSLISDLLQAGV